jgi:hypothetical protein
VKITSVSQPCGDFEQGQGRNGNYRHGRYTAETIAARRRLRKQIREVKALTKKL